MGFSLNTVDDLGSMGFSKIRAVSDMGFHIGIVFNFILSQNLDLRLIPSFSFGERFVEYYEDDLSEYSARQELDPYSLELPLLIKYNIYNMSRSSIYAVGGAKYSYDLRIYDNMQMAGDDILYVQPRKSDYHIKGGLGFQRNLRRIKLSTEIRASFGLMNLVLPGNVGTRYYESIDRLLSRNIMISLIIE